MTDTITVTVDGQQVVTELGRTVAAVLVLARDRLAWRETRFEREPRGLFCGIGVCFDCLVTVDGRSSMRACLVQVADGMVVDSGAYIDE